MIINASFIQFYCQLLLLKKNKLIYQNTLFLSTVFFFSSIYLNDGEILKYKSKSRYKAIHNLAASGHFS